ncbi:DUF4386 domain-containing protein [Dyella flagellata]|uniref:DUF4386 domain-containing protein n=1 Tax=Dyella flagellata TaxID=1867833 RepID=A0ABQ5XBJ3_9GAMM|nr:DUF4386 domain-containing protein [Dyella flagellata]GLQ89013.1 hypothetical protein GCM10007898_25850 [Dyella flagellata]
MENRADIDSPQIYARAAGWLYLVVIAAGFFAEFFVRERLINYGDASASAHAIMANGLLFRLGFSADLATIVCDIPMEMMFYLLLRPVNKHMALLVMLFALLGDATMAASELHGFAPLLILGDSPYLTAFSTSQLQAMALLNMHSLTAGLVASMVFFGCHCFFLGYLVFKSGYLPKIIGILIVIACPCLLINSFGYFLAPGLIPEFILLPDLIAELALCVWLIVMGVNIAKWKESARSVRGHASD